MRELCRFTEPVKNQECILAQFEIDEIVSPPIQRDISESLKKQLEFSIDKLGFLVPVVVVRKNGYFYVVDGQHRLEALRSLGAKEVVGILVDESYYKFILDFNTERPANIREKSKQAYRLYMEIMKENDQIIESSLYPQLRNPVYVTLGFVLEEIDARFPAGFYDSFLAKIEIFLDMPLVEAVKERRQRATALQELNSIVNSIFIEFGWNNPLLKGEILKKAIQKTYGLRVRTIEDDFYKAIEEITHACQTLSKSDFENNIYW